MKRFFLILIIITLLTTSLHSQVEIKTYVNDYANIISEQEEQDLSTKLNSLNQQGLAQIAIVTIPSLEGRDIEGYALELAQGHLGETDKNNGLLLLIAVQDHQYRFEIGRGLEPIFNDAKVGRIGRTYLTPAFKEEKYAEGIVNAVNSIQSELANPTTETEQNDSQSTSSNWLFWIALSFIILINIITFIANKQRRTLRKDDYFNAALGAVLLGGRRGGGNGGFGGSGGFGGGGFGGGGSSGGW